MILESPASHAIFPAHGAFYTGWWLDHGSTGGMAFSNENGALMKAGERFQPKREIFAANYCWRNKEGSCAQFIIVGPARGDPVFSRSIAVGKPPSGHLVPAQPNRLPALARTRNN
jgi:hypothetical protein